MREIKFRAWIGKIMWKHGSFDLEEVIEDSNVPLMQFTGLHDATGTEIFEGDILKSPLTGCVGVVDFKFGAFIVKGFMEGDFICYLAAFLSDGSEKIGNIYEHPDLMKP